MKDLESLSQEEREFQAAIIRISNSGDLEFILKLIEELKADSQYQRLTETVYTKPELLMHWNGVEAGYCTIESLIKNCL